MTYLLQTIYYAWQVLKCVQYVWCYRLSAFGSAHSEKKRDFAFSPNNIEVIGYTHEQKKCVISAHSAQGFPDIFDSPASTQSRQDEGFRASIVSNERSLVAFGHYSELVSEPVEVKYKGLSCYHSSAKWARARPVRTEVQP